RCIEATHRRRRRVASRVRLPGQYFDAETGLNYNYQRDYESATGRYIESDPIGLGDGPSTYSYVKSRPLYTYDRFGLAEFNDFAPDQKKKMEDAINTAIEVMKKCSSCYCYPGNERYCLTEDDRSEIQRNLSSATYDLVVAVGMYGPDLCGQAPPDKPNHISITSGGLAGNCCNLPALLAHEANHMNRTGAGTYNRGSEDRSLYIEQQCFNCKIRWGRPHG
ncbi:RHS repeat-associated core domain-containing protein, partial [Dokdonella soli]